MSTGFDREPPLGWSDADLLELLLGGSRSPDADADRAQVARDPKARARLAELQGFLAHSRQALSSEPSASDSLSERRLVARVLARTTRRRARSLRGDLALATRWLRSRLSGSPRLRLAVGLLIVQALGLLLVAWLAWRAPRTGLAASSVAQRARVEPFLPAEPLPPPAAPLEADRALRLAAQALESTDWPAGAAAEVESESVQRVLAARARAASGRLEDSELEALLSTAAPADGLDRALLAELLLDVWALKEQQPAGPMAAFRRWGRDSREGDAIRHLEQLALERARGYGLRIAVSWRSPILDTRPPPPPRSIDPVDSRWRAALLAALEENASRASLLEHPGLRAWLRAGSSPR